MWSLPERAQDRLDRHLGRARNAGIMRPESVEPMRIGGGKQRFAMRGRGCARPAIEIEPALVKMTDLDRIEAINFPQEPLADRSAQNKKRVGREREERIAAPGAQLAQIVESAQLFDLVRLDIEEHDIGPLQPYLGRLDEENSHRRRLGKHFRSIEDLIVQSDGERAETELARPFQKLVRGIIEMVLRIVEGMDMEIELDPILFPCLALRHRLKLDAGFGPRLRFVGVGLRG